MARKRTPVLKQAGSENELLELVALLAELSVLDPSEFNKFGERLRSAKKCSGNTNEDS